MHFHYFNVSKNKDHAHIRTFQDEMCSSLAAHEKILHNRLGAAEMQPYQNSCPPAISDFNHV